MGETGEIEFVNIGLFCDAVKIKYGKNIILCNATYDSKDDVLLFNIQYEINGKKSTYQHCIDNIDFMITDIEVKVDYSVIQKINQALHKRLNTIIQNYYA